MKAWINGGFVDWEKATVPILSHSFSRGSAVFEVVDTVSTDRGPAFFGLAEHVERFFNSARYTYMEIPISREEIVEGCLASARVNGVSIGAAKFFAYYSTIQFDVLPEDGKVDVAIFCADFGLAERRLKNKGKPVKATISPYRKIHPQSVPIHAKVTGNYVGGFIAKMEARKKGYQDVILLDTEGFVAESATANVFMVKDGVVKTPTLRSVLPGINRMAVIELLRDMGCRLEETDIRPEEFLGCDEAFYTASTIKVVPMESIDDKKLGRVCPGPVTKAVLSQVEKILHDGSGKYDKWLTYISGP